MVGVIKEGNNNAIQGLLYYTMRAYTLANIGSMVAVLIGVVNLLTFRELWVLLAAVAILVFLAVYALKEKRKLQRQQQTHNHKHK
jgi:membrane protein implicated in regulation of membrane protease activity